jgi:hypothetical protein
MAILEMAYGFVRDLLKFFSKNITQFSIFPLQNNYWQTCVVMAHPADFLPK